MKIANAFNAKKMLVLTSVVAFTGLAVAGSNQIEKLNQTIVQMLANFNNATTSAEVVIFKAKNNAKRAVELAGRALYTKTVGDDSVSIQLTDVDYSFPETKGAKPEMRGRGQLDIDLLKLLGGQDGVNEFAQSVEQELLVQMAQDMMSEYGDAVKVNTEVISKDVDANGNYKKLDVKLSMKIDMAKLAKDKVETLEFTEGTLRISATLKRISAEVRIVPNKKGRSFKEDEMGMKEYIQALLKQDPDTLLQLGSYIESLDNMATQYLFPAPTTP